jgi:hypothetical protein
MRWQRNHYRPTLELLEKRDLPATALLSGGYLYVNSTAAHEYVNISQSNGHISVANTLITEGSSKVSSVYASQVTRVAVYAYGGSDVINLRTSAATAVTKDSYIYAAGGNNQVFGGNGSNYIIGGTGGHNMLTGGTATDYLAAGSATDTLNGGGGFDWFYRPITAGAPFVNGALVSDVKQGQAPSCQADAVLAEAVKQGFNFANSIHYLGNSTYDINLYGGSVHERVAFNGWYNSDDPIPAASGEYWAILLYRGRLEALGINPNAAHTMAQWDAINRGDNGRLYSVSDAVTAFTGRSSFFAPISSITPQSMQADLARGDYFLASTPPGSSVNSDGIAYDHTYAVMAVYYQGGMWKVRLYNPWGFDSANGRTIESLSGVPPTNRGFITLSWAQFANRQNFTGFTQAAANAAQVAYFKTLSGNRE